MRLDIERQMVLYPCSPIRLRVVGGLLIFGEKLIYAKVDAAAKLQCEDFIAY